MVNTLVLNVGSSSVKFRLYQEDEVAVDAYLDCIGEHAKLVVCKSSIPGLVTHDVRARTHSEGAQLIRQLLCEVHIDRTIHRIVHGGKYHMPVKAQPEVRTYLHSLVPLAPLHLPASLAVLDIFSEQAILCFDTMFHAHMPAYAKAYALPQAVTQKHNITRTGFHGLAHQGMADAARSMLGDNCTRIITCQLGNGSSVCAIRNGQSIDTSMGFTPLEGLMMGTRSGDIDPAIIPYLCTQEKMTPQEVLEMLEHHSGLLALGGSNDVRELLQRDASGDAAAALALDAYAYRVRKYIGAYLAALGGADAIVLGGGVARSPVMRSKILQGLENLGIQLDKNSQAAHPPAIVGTGKIPVLMVETDEEQLMFTLAREI